MDTTLVSQSLDRVEADAVVVLLFEDDAAPPELKSAAAWLDELRASGEFTGKTGEMAVQHLPHGFTAKRLVVAGGGKRDKFDAAVLRRAVGTVVRALKQKGVKKLAWWLAGGRCGSRGRRRDSRQLRAGSLQDLQRRQVSGRISYWWRRESAHAAFERGKILARRAEFHPRAGQ